MQSAELQASWWRQHKDSNDRLAAQWLQTSPIASPSARICAWSHPAKTNFLDPKLLQVRDRKCGSHKCCHSSSGDLSLPEAATSKTWAWAPSPILWRAALSWKVTKVTSAHKDYEPTKQIDSRMYDLWFITYHVVFIWMCVYIICKSRVHQYIVYHNESHVIRAIWYYLSFAQSRGLHRFSSIYADVVRCYNLRVAYIGLLHLVSCLEVYSSKLQTNLYN